MSELPEELRLAIRDTDIKLSRSWSYDADRVFHNRIYAAATEILQLYEKYGSADYIGEEVTQKEHGLMCALRATEDTRLQQYEPRIVGQFIVAAFLHDIGHLIGLDRAGEKTSICMIGTDGDSLGIYGHENIGAEYLRQAGLPELVCNLVGSHVKAKRYLCTRDETYLSQLSLASASTMRLQGGLMSTEELEQFEDDPIFEMALMLRGYDDGGKDTQLHEEQGNDVPMSELDAVLFELILSSCK